MDTLNWWGPHSLWFHWLKSWFQAGRYTLSELCIDPFLFSIPLKHRWSLEWYNVGSTVRQTQTIPHILMKLVFASIETLPVAKRGDKEDHLQRLLSTFCSHCLFSYNQYIYVLKQRSKRFEGDLNHFYRISAHEVNTESDHFSIIILLF